MRSTLLMVVAGAVSAVIFAPPSEAHMRGGRVEVGGYVLRANFDSDSNTENDEGLGARLGILFTSAHELEFSLDRISTEDEFGFGLDVDLTSFKVGYVYNFAPAAGVSPLFTAGGGFQRLQVSEETGFGSQELEDEADPLAFAGFGLRFFIGPVFNIRLDGQAQAIFPNDDPDDALLDGVLSAGAGWVIGGR